MTWPGPPLLGRGVVVNHGQAPPPAWEDCPVIVVDEAVVDETVVDEAGPTVGELHDAWRARRPVVVSLAVDPARFSAPVAVTVEPWTLAASYELWLDRLHFLVWNNTYDARNGDPIWWWSRKAARLGAQVGGDADVILPDGRAAWVDGGPRGPLDPPGIGAPVVPAESILLGRLAVQPPPVAPASALAPDQLAAVAHGAGPARVIAPAGSGKTRVLTERLRHLLVDRGFEPATVLAVAYNKKAQEELESRCAGLGPRVRTLNALGYSLLTRARGSLRLLDERQIRRVVEDLVPARPRRANTDPIAPYLEALSLIRLGLRDPDEVEGERDDVPGVAAAFPRFRAALSGSGAIDFDEQIYGAIEVLLADGEFRRRAQAGCQHLLVDEFQDLTPAHVLLLRLLASPQLDVFGVGDDDQVIYGHAGADPGFLIDFDRYFPGAAAHPLEVNYRCPVAVVDAARNLLDGNLRRVAKVIRPGPDAAAGADRLQIRTHPAADGARTLVEQVQAWLAEPGTSPGRVAVLARVNSLLLAPHAALLDAGVPIQSVLRPEVLERTGVRAALAYLRIATNPKNISGADVVEILRRPSRGLPQWFPDRLRRRGTWTIATLRGVAASVPDKERPKVHRLVDDLQLVCDTRAVTAELLDVVRDEIGLGRAMSLLDGPAGGEGASHLDDLDALAQVAALHPDPAGFETWLRAALTRPADNSGVTLSTVHRVKGMEWDRVAVFGVTEGIVPHRLAVDDEEERRVLHVAITRGIEQVVVLGDSRRRSPFLAELRGERPVRAARPAQAPPTVSRAARRAPAPPAQPLSPIETRREEALRTWRRGRAKADGVPAFVVFQDLVLQGIARAAPDALEDLARLWGVGPTKLELYGDDVLAVLAEVADEPSSSASSASTVAAGARQAKSRQTYPKPSSRPSQSGDG
jgi:DNA helicase-2/ATP-dependent DNA helicase PcrA